MNFTFKNSVCKWAATGMVTAALSMCLSAQNSTDPPSSTIVSKSAEAVTGATIQPNPSGADPSAESIMVDPASLLPDLPPVPRANATLMGGTIARLDRVRDRISLNVFGGGRTTVLFDPRTKIYRGTKEVTITDLRQGERVYLDTILDGTQVFARSIRLGGGVAAGESQGVIVKYRMDKGEIEIRDGISPTPVTIRTNNSTTVMQQDRSVPVTALQPGSLVVVTFSSEGNGHDVARQISILALPGSRFTFSGEVTHIDLRSRLLVLDSSVDRKTYELYLDPSLTPDDALHTGSNVTAVTNYESSRYVVHELTLTPSH